MIGGPPTPPPAPAPPPPPNPPPAPDTPEPSPPRAPKARFNPSLEAGYAYLTAYGVPMNGLGLSAVLPAVQGNLRWGGVLEATFAQTQYGLPVATTGLGVLLEVRVGRLGAGGGLRVGTFNVGRVTTSGNLFNLSAGANARLSFDLVTWNEAKSAVFLVAKGSFDTIGTALFGATGGLGVRF